MPLNDGLSVVNYSIVSELARNFQTLLGPPEIEYPLRSVVQRSESSGLPDGSVHDELLSSPIGETLDKAIARMSREANAAWQDWLDTAEQPKLTITGDISVPLNKSIEDSLLTQEEQIQLTRIRRLLIIEQILFKRDNQRDMTRIINESPRLQSDFIPSEPVNRFYQEVEITQNEFGVTKKKILTKDRCQGKPEVKITSGVQVSNIVQSRFNPSYTERLDNITMTTFQTERWRKPARNEEEEYIPNISPLDDPDFITPSDISSRNFVIYPPASRPYSCVFKMTKLDGSVVRFYPKKGKNKDYTSLSSLSYMLNSKSVKYSSLEIDEVNQKTSNGRRIFPNCKFEIDLRVTYGPELVPDPNSYKKVDPDTKLGKKLLQLLNEQPYLFNEHSWEYENVNEKGDIEKTKKVAVSFKIPNPKDSIGPRVYWVYIDEKSNTIGTPSFLRTKKVAPQYHFEPMRYYKKDDPNYIKKDQPFLASVRVSDNYSYYDRKLKKFINFSDVEAVFISFLNSKGYILYDKVPESEFNSVVVYKFIHKDTSTRNQRKLLFKKLTNHD